MSIVCQENPPNDPRYCFVTHQARSEAVVYFLQVKSLLFFTNKQHIRSRRWRAAYSRRTEPSTGCERKRGFVLAAGWLLKSPINRPQESRQNTLKASQPTTNPPAAALLVRHHTVVLLIAVIILLLRIMCRWEGFLHEKWQSSRDYWSNGSCSTDGLARRSRAVHIISSVLILISIQLIRVLFSDQSQIHSCPQHSFAHSLEINRIQATTLEERKVNQSLGHCAEPTWLAEMQRIMGSVSGLLHCKLAVQAGLLLFAGWWWQEAKNGAKELHTPSLGGWLAAAAGGRIEVRWNWQYKNWAAPIGMSFAAIRFLLESVADNPFSLGNFHGLERMNKRRTPRP